MTERARQITYYLDQINERVTLHSDGRVGELGQLPKEVTERLPSRRIDRPRTSKRTRHVLADVAMHDSIQDYLANTPRHEGRSFSDDTWEIEDFPDDVQAAFYEWNDHPQFAVEEFHDAAVPMQAGLEALRTELIDCTDCPSDSGYACRRSAWSRQMYRYPIVNFSHEGEDIMVPPDIAGVVAMNPDALRYDVQIRALGSEKRLNAHRSLVFDITQVPAAYVGASGDGMLQVHGSDKLRTNLELWVSEWNETGKEEPRRVPAKPFDSRHPVAAGEYINALQMQLAERVCEVPETERYDEMLSYIQVELGRRGLVVTYEHSYDGMGESSPKLKALQDDGDHYSADVYIVSSISAADCLKEALAAVHKVNA